MGLEKIFPLIIRKITDRTIVDIEGLYKGIFHSWISRDTLAFIGEQESKPVMIEINKDNVIKTPEGEYLLNEPYQIFPSNDFTEGELRYLLDKRLKGDKI